MASSVRLVKFSALRQAAFAAHSPPEGEIKVRRCTCTKVFIRSRSSSWVSLRTGFCALLMAPSRGLNQAVITYGLMHGLVHHLVAASPGRCITWSLHHLVISDRIHTCQPALQPLSTSRCAAPHAQTLPVQSLHCALCPCDTVPL